MSQTMEEVIGLESGVHAVKTYVVFVTSVI